MYPSIFVCLTGNHGRAYEFLDFISKRLCNVIDAKAHDVAFSDCMQILVENKRNLLFHIPNVFFANASEMR